MRNFMTNGNDKQSNETNSQDQIGMPISSNESPLDLEFGHRGDAEGQVPEIVPEIANESFDAANETSQQLIADGELFLELSRQLEADTKKKFREVLEDLESLELETQSYRKEITTDPQQQALEFLKLEAESYRDKIIADAQEEARAQLEKSSAEAKKIIAEAEQTRKEVREELEAQKILTDAAKIREEAHEILGDIKRHLNEPQDSPSQ